MSSAEVSTAYTDRVFTRSSWKSHCYRFQQMDMGKLSLKREWCNFKRAAGYDNEEIEYDKQVLIIEVKNGTFFVKEYVATKINRGMDMEMEMY